jgi:hypothetical protein
MTIVLQFAPSREAQAKTQKRLRKHIKDARDGLNTGKRIVKLQADDMVDLTDPRGVADGR